VAQDGGYIIIEHTEAMKVSHAPTAAVYAKKAEQN